MKKNESELATEMVQSVLEILKSKPDHSRVSAVQLMNEAGIDTDYMNMLELFAVYNKLIQEAEKIGIRLDYSEYDGEDVGLPFNLQAVVIREGK